jgi:putative ABC transport system permease protein
MTLDVFANTLDQAEDQIYRLHSMPENINQVYLLGGRMPQSADECLLDGAFADDSALGSQFTVSNSNDADTLEGLNCRSFTVVGYVSTPLYMDMVRGSTTLGSGQITGYLYIPREAFAVDYYTEIYVTMPGQWDIYSPEYTDAMDALAELLEPKLEGIALTRFAQLKADAEKAYADGFKEYENGLKEYEDGKVQADTELADALKQLQDAQTEIDKNSQTLAEGEVQLQDALKLLAENEALLVQSRLDFENAKAEAYAQMAQADAQLRKNEQEVQDGLTQIEEALPQLEDGLTQIEDGLAQIEEGLPQLELAITLTQTQISMTQGQLELAKLLGNESRVQELETQLAEQNAALEAYKTQRSEAVKMQSQLLKQKQELTAQYDALLTTKATLEAAQVQIADGYQELESNRLQAESQFASAQAELTAGQLELEKGKKEFQSKQQELEEGKTALADARAELDKAWAEYETGKLEAEAELADGLAKLKEAEAELADARNTIDTMEAPSVYALTRNTNAGYLALDSNSDIVSGVAVVLPVFFLLIAALVCITTMTRMVEEERTQIGTLKALGYSGYQIMGKYLAYSASAAILGCALGVAVGCSFFPKLLWNAYGIIFNITPDVELLIDWPLSLGVAAAYILVSSLMTWYCCHRTLREVPAELIRPKAPTAGKKIFLEKLPFWNKLSFLNKVMLRNVLRYRQRLLMMLVGIGGCTALLLTGFGMRDTIVDIANIQYEEVSLFDMEVYFSEGQTPQQQETFREALEGTAKEVGFFYQSSVELEFDSQARDVYLICMDEQVQNFIHFHSGEEALGLPETGEAYLSVGASELMGIGLGDTVTVRNADLQMLTLTVTGIFDNHLNNYIYVSPETVAAQWGEAPMSQMAYVTVPEGTDASAAGQIISSMEQVINLSVSADTADMFASMMEALEAVIVVIVMSAGLLAAIVLYNLTNINITERIREIATIKVLGFNAKETSAYVFKENILLTVLGAGGGLILGKYFLDFVMSKIKIDIVWFATRLSVPSYIFSVLLTLLCATVVDYIFHHKLQKINMAEALKSVE